MKKRLLHIKRAVSAPRPAEADLEWENQIDGVPVFMTQDPTKDTYIQVRSDKSPEATMLELQAMEETSHLKRDKTTEDTNLWDYPYADKLTGRTEARSKVIPESTDIDGEVVPERTVYADVTVRVLNDVGGETVFTGETAYDDAMALVATLNDTDGYVIFDNIEGEKTEVLTSRPYIVETEDNIPVLKLTHTFSL